MPEVQDFAALSTEVSSMLITCYEAIHEGALIERESRQDKEFPFQNWMNYTESLR